MDALDFLKTFEDKSVDIVLYDPPYSPRQVAECYKKLEKTVNIQITQASYWGNQKKEIARIVKDNGFVISCAWNSGGIGRKYGFNIVEILLVTHGGWHNHTIVTVEKKGGGLATANFFPSLYVQGYTAALQDAIDVVDYIQIDLKYHKRRQSYKTYKAILKCMLKNRVYLRENPNSFIRCNDNEPGGFEIFVP